MAEAWQSAWVQVLPDFKDFTRKANSQMSGILGGAGTAGGLLAGKNAGAGVLGGIKGIAGPLVAAVAALGIGRLIGNAIGEGINYALDSVDLASDLEQSTGAVLAVFKDQATIIEGFGKNAAKDVGLARTEYQKFAVVVGAQLKNLGIPVAAVSGQTNDLIELGADLAAQFGGPTSDAVNALSSLLRGERDPIERYGVGIKQADINARLASQGLKDLTGDAKKQAEIQATLAILWEQTADAQGTFAREGDTLAGQQQRLQAALQDTQTKLGEALLPAFSKIVGYTTSELLPKFEQFIDKVGPKLSDALEKAGPKFEELAEKAGPLLEDFIIAGTEAIPDMVKGLGDLADGFSDVMGWLDELDRKNKPALDFLSELFNLNGETPDAGFLGVGSPMADKFKKDFEEQMRDAGQAGGQRFSDGLTSKKPEVEAGFLGISSPMAQKLNADMQKSLREAGANAGQSFADGIQLKEAVAALRGRELGRAAAQALRYELKMASPSKVMRELGGYTGEGYALGIEGSKSKVDSAMRSLVSVPSISADVQSSVSLSGSTSSLPPIYVQNPFTGEYLLAKVDSRAKSVLGESINRAYAASR